MRSVEVNDSIVYILGTVKGLVSEAQKVEEAFRHTDPQALAISISKEQLEALKHPELYECYELSPLEEAYFDLMSSFGEVRLPSPSYVKALELAKASSRPIIPIDMNERMFTEFYCANVGALDLVREGLFSRSVRRRRFEGNSPEGLALDWDRKVNRAKGFRRLEARREMHMAEALRRMTSRYRKILAVIDWERAEGVLNKLS